MSDEQIEQITRLYGDFTDGDEVKVFPNEAFGYQRITVERPLRVKWEVTSETLGRVAGAKAWEKFRWASGRL